MKKNGNPVKSKNAVWDEIGIDESARLRTNTILFSGITSCFFLIMAVYDIVAGQTCLLAVSIALAIVSSAVFFLQLALKQYRRWIAYVYGLMSIVMSVYLLYTGGMEGYSFLWIFLVPTISVMVVGRRDSLVFNIILQTIIVVMLQTPLHTRLLYDYPSALRTLFPLAIFFLTCCVYVGELMRYRTQRKLADTTEKLRSFAYNDPLTGAYNRHALVSHFADLDSDAYGLSFAMIDLDYFKRVNDRYGHITGDKVLIHIVRLITEDIPPNATLYRWGGEEFLLILKTMDETEAMAICEAIRRHAETTPLIAGEHNIRVTLSIGRCHGAEGTTINECIAAADENLYRAKQSGRNRVVA